jgi:WD40 repeat protein
MPRTIDPRRTFLHRHIPGELDPPYRPGPGFREEVLAIDLLRRRLGQAFDCPRKIVHHLVGRRTFFYGLSDYKLYLEVRVTPVDREDDAPRHYQDLTDLLSRPPGRHPGVLLAARSGAGKSTAMLKSFHDCFRSLPGAEPLLAGHLPCYLRDLSVGVPAIEAAVRGRRPTAVLIEALIRRAAGLQKAELRHVRRWLRHTEKLLVFIDLNTAAQDVRPHLARALAAYQRKYHEHGHRCIVAYRAVGGDTSRQALLEGGWFGACDLEPLPHGTAQKYLDNLGHVENKLRAELAGKHRPAAHPPGRDAGPPGAAAAALRSLIDRHARGGDSILSTPLLMHFFSVIGAAGAEVQSLAGLYAAVVDEYLKRDYGDPDAATPLSPYAEATADSGLAEPEGRERILTAMARVALAILADGPEATRLQPRAEDTTSVQVLGELLAKPGATRYWWPVDAWWHEGDYFHTPYPTKEERRALKEFSLLRRDGKVFGFLHDSFLYYFAALAVRCPRKPLLGLSPLDGPELTEWCGKAVARLHAEPAAWKHPAEFLGGMLAWEELALVTRGVLATPSRLGWPDVLLSLVRGRRRPEGQDDPLLAGVERALLHKLPGVFGGLAEATAMVGTVYHYLRDAARLPSERQAWLEQLLRRLRERGARWLHSAGPTFWPRPVLRVHQGGVIYVAVLQDGRVVAGGADGQVVLWDQETGNWEVLYQHPGRTKAFAVSADGSVVASVGASVWDGEARVCRAVDGVADPEPLIWNNYVVTAVAVSKDGRVVASGGVDGSVRRAVDGIADPEPLVRHHKEVTAVAVSKDGRVVASAGRDGCLWRAVDGVAGPEPLLWHYLTLSAVAVSKDGTVVASGAYDGCLWRAVDGVADPEPLLRHDGMVRAVAVSKDGRVVASGGEDGFVRRAVDGVSDLEPLHQHNGEVWAVAVSKDGRVVASGGEDGFVRRAVDGVADPRPLLRHSAGVSAVAVSEDGRVVASGGADSCVRCAVDGVADPEPPLRHNGKVWAVAISEDGRFVASGGQDGFVRRAVDDVADPEPLLRHNDYVLAVAVSKDGRVVASGGADSCVRRAVDGVADPEPLLRHDGMVRAVAVSKDGRVVASGGHDYCVRRAVDGVADPEPLLRHNDFVLAVAVSKDGRVVASGGGDASVWRAVDGVADPEPLLRHHKPVTAVAVSEDGRVVASGGHDGFVLRTVDGVADVDCVGYLEPLFRHNYRTNAVAVSEDGRVVASGGDDGFVRRAVDGVADPEPLHQHNGEVWAVAVSKDGRVVASGGEDAAIHLWFADDHPPLVHLCNAGVHGLSMTATGRRVIGVLENGEILTLDLVIPDGASSGGLG